MKCSIDNYGERSLAHILHARHTRRQPPSAIAVSQPRRGRPGPILEILSAAGGRVVNNNNVPFLSGFTSSNVVQNNNGNGNSIIGGVPGFPVLNSANFPSGSTLQKLMFGTMTVFDDELTEGHDLGSGLVGKAQGFYIANSEDGSSQTMAFTVMLAEGGYADSVSFFGAHRTAMAESHSGKYVNAKGFATVKTFLAPDQHETDGVETLLRISIYLAY